MASLSQITDPLLDLSNSLLKQVAQTVAGRGNNSLPAETTKGKVAAEVENPTPWYQKPLVLAAVIGGGLLVAWALFRK